MDNKPMARTALSIWPNTLLKLNRLKGDVGAERGSVVDLDTLINELIDHYRATVKKPARPAEHA